MNQLIKNFVSSSLQPFNISVTRRSSLQKMRGDLLALEAASRDIELLLALPNDHAARLVANLRKSKSQLRQDLFVLSQLNFKTGGFFVEFGATDGVVLSNSNLLEKEFGWSGILAEPAKCWHQGLSQNRSAHIEHNCVWRDSTSTLTFNEVDEAELSTITSYNDSDSHGNTREKGQTYDVKTISLNDLLTKYNAPSRIDYLSIDTEGSEFDILSDFDFGKHAFTIITCEHNFTPMRERIYDLLTRNGYVRKFQKLSKWDDWYVNSIP